MPRLRGRSGESAYSDFPDRRGDELASARVGKASWAKEHGYPHELELQDGPCILVAHSYGGTIITEAGVDPHVTALV